MEEEQIKGTINKVQPGKTHGWISRKQLYFLNGNEKKIQGKKDIFVHVDDSDVPLEVGTEVVFDLTFDESDHGGYRANNVHLFVPENYLELHVDATTIDNPSVPLRWCFTPEMHQRIVEGTKKGYTYAILLVIRHQDDQNGYREQREVKSPKYPFTFVTFSKAGKWDVGMVLYECKNVSVGVNNETELVRSIKSRYLVEDSYRDHSAYRSYIPRLQLEGFPAELALQECEVWQHHFGKPIAASEITIEIPDGIFAPEPSPTMMAFANRFFSTSPYDECNHRQRLLIMIFGGWVPWLMIEAVLRGVNLAGALVQLLFAFKGSLKNIGHTFKPAVSFDGYLSLPEWGKDDNQFEQACYRPWNSKIGFWLTPGFLVLYSLAVWVLYWAAQGTYFLWGKLLEVAPWAPQALLTIVAGAVIYGISLYLMRRFKGIRLEHEDEREEKRVDAKRALVLETAKKRAEALEQSAPALVCGGPATHVVSLKAIPTELRTFKMRFDAVKRQVCRPFA